MTESLMAAPLVFDVSGPLPGPGITVLEASAGTGKTFTIAALAARYVASGVPLDRMLLVTFTRMATSELRERVRERLVHAERGLAGVLGGAEPDTHDDVLGLLALGSPDDVARRRRRLARALADFDAATISTTHGFCQHILSGLGLAGGVEPGFTFVEDVADLVEEVVDDLYVLKFNRKGRDDPFGRDQAQRIARVAVENPLAHVLPADDISGAGALMRSRLASKARDEVDRRKRARRIMTYDDQLTRLAQTLRHDTHGPVAQRRLRELYQVALVDEFQDTDPIQWEIMQRAFGDGAATLVLIGDPKQAIYSFRGADVHAYLEAARAADEIATLGVNWRSDQPLLDAYDALLRKTNLGHAEIRYRTVKAAPAHQASRLAGAPHPEPVRVRIAHRDDGQITRTKLGWASNASARAHVAKDLAADVVALLSSGAEITTPPSATATATAASSPQTPGRPERVHPGHLAVLVRTNRQAGVVRDALDAVGVPAVINGAGSVFETPMAGEWLSLLEALERPSSVPRVRAAALTCFIGWDAERLAAADDDAWEEVHGRLHRWSVVLRDRGVASLFECISRAEALPARLLGDRDGERKITDLRHVGQLLHLEVMTARLGLTALAAWLRQRIDNARNDAGSVDQSRRLDSDADAVQVLTIHRSKGLEFPIVYFPYLWEPGWFDKDTPQVFHDPDNHDERAVDVGMAGGAFERHQFIARQEQRGEDLRLMYVALTRARHQAVLWWATSYDSAESPLGRLLFARDDEGNVDTSCGEPPIEQSVARRLASLAEDAPSLIGVERTGDATGTRWAGPTGPALELGVSPFDRSLDLQWRRTSYTALTSGAHEQAIASEREDLGLTDEALLDDVMVNESADAAGTAVGDADGVYDVMVNESADATGTVVDVADSVDVADAADTPDRAAEVTRHTVVTIVAGATATAALDDGRDPATLPPVPLESMPGGAAVGSLVHAMFEHADFAAADLDAELATQLEAQTWRQLDVGEPAMVITGLRAALETPLGPLVGELRLRDLATQDRLDELDFELPLVGGDVPTASLMLDSFVGLLREHLPPQDILAGYADRLAELEPRELRGYLVGSIDLALRVPAGPGAPGDDRIAVVDYKTNWLGGPGESLTAWHYRPEALVEAMHHAHYPLQALIYSVALHRYLRWRRHGYDPARHLGGVLYLFIRGMTGADGPRIGGQPCGVFSWQPPATLVVALSDLFDRGDAA